uniref:Retroviral polymerase SH3-like domain-containing protein n=1 Tax=Tanacetum cinerariifolium TaxID=118510 RepID=A0A6L2M425_TANCI|nr:hypothetical protein [Tanacetum cinerariifolium]
MILSGADNHPLMLDKDLNDSSKSRMELYMQNREHERMILESVEHGSLIWPTVEENGVIRTKKYAKLSAAEKIQANCDMKATNIILQGLPADIYSLVNHHRVAKDLWERVQLVIQVQQFQERQGQNYSGTTYKGNATSSRGNTTSGQEKAMLAEAREAGQILDEEQFAFLADPGIPTDPAQIIIPHNAAFQTKDLDTYDSDCDDLSTAQVVLMANISNYGSDVISKVSNSKTYLNDMDNQSVHALQDFKQSPVMDFTDNEISSDSNIIPYSQYLQETQQVLGYQNPFNLKKAQRIKPTLYDGVVLSNTHVAMLVIDDEETLILEKESRSKRSEKAKDPEFIAKKISHKPINYAKLKNITNDFGKRFSPQQELLAEQAFLFHILNPNIEPSYTPPVILDIPSELPKEHSDSLINKLNLKSTENEDLKAQIQDKVFVITSLKNDLRKLKGKVVVDNAAQIPSATIVAPRMFKLDLEPLAPKPVHNRESHIYYLKDTQEQADILRGIVKQAKAKQPLDNALDFTCKHAKRIQELLVYVQDTCPSAINLSKSKIARTPMNKIKKVTFAEPIASSSTNQKKHGNTRNNRIAQPSSSNKINKVENQPRSVKSRKNKKNRVNKVKCNDHVMQSMSNVNSVSVSIKNAPVKDSVNDVTSGCLCAIYGCPDCTLVSGIRMFETHDRESLSTHELSCYTQNRSLKCLRHNKTPYELIHDKKPDLSFFYVFGSLCYPTNDHEDLGKFDAKANIRIFVGYAPAKKSFRIYNRRTQKFFETIHVTFDELTAMASEQFSSGPALHSMTPATSSTGLVSNPVSKQPCIPPNTDDWIRLFQPMFDEYFNPPTIVVSPFQEAATPRAEVLADSPVSFFINQDAPSTRSSSNVIQIHTPFEHLGRWTKDHPIENVIDDPSRSVSTRKQLETDAMWCYFEAFLTSVEPKNFKQAMTEPSWIDAMQEEIHEFERLKV